MLAYSAFIVCGYPPGSPDAPRPIHALCAACTPAALAPVRPRPPPPPCAAAAISDPPGRGP